MEAYVIVRLDGETTYATIKAETKSEPTSDSEPEYHYHTQTSTPPSSQPTYSSSKINWTPIFWIFAAIFLLFVIIPKSNNDSYKNKNIETTQIEIPTTPVTLIADESFSPEVTRAKEIMGKNFIGPETVMKHFNILLDEEGVEAFKKIPFSEKTLLAHKDDCILVADFGISLASLEKIFTDKKDILFDTTEDSNYNITFKDYEAVRKHQWHLIYKSPLPNPTYKNYNEQINYLPKGLYILKVASIAYAALLYHLKTQEYLFFDEIPNSNDKIEKDISGSDIGTIKDKNGNKKNAHGTISYYRHVLNSMVSIAFGAKYNDYNDYYTDIYYAPEFDGDPFKTRTIYLAVALKPEK